MISLDTVTLSDDFLWLNRYSEPSSILSMRRAISGNPIIQQAPEFPSGKTITIGTVDGDSGWWTKAQLEGIKVLEASGDAVTFIYEDQQFQVIVLPGTVNVEPLIKRPNSADADNFIGTISLITI